MSQPAVQLPSMSFTGSNAASIDALDATKNARKGAPVSSLDLDPTPDMTASRRCLLITTTRMLSVTVSV